jgi:hypothetical protein
MYRAQDSDSAIVGNNNHAIAFGSNERVIYSWD